MSDLCMTLRLRQSTTSQHLRVLKDAHLVIVRAQGNQRFYRANPEELARLQAFLAEFWSASLSSLQSAAERRARERGRR